MSKGSDIGWYINEWLAYRDLAQVDLCRLTGWKKAKVSAFCTGRSAYTRDIIDKCASVMGIHPNELLLPPQRAIELRRLEALKHQFLGRESDN